MAVVWEANIMLPLLMLLLPPPPLMMMKYCIRLRNCLAAIL